MRRDSEYKIDKSEVLRYLGHRGQELDRELEALIDEMSARCLAAARPRYAWEVFPLWTEDGQPILGTAGVRLLGEDIRKHLSGSAHCAVLGATLGIEAERELARVSARSSAAGVVFNAACTALIEDVADVCEAEIVAYARDRGMTCTWRYGPGYGDMPLSQQREVLEVIQGRERLGITLTDSFLMIPRKSVTGLIGLKPGAGERQGTACEHCENRDNCEFRKGGASCGR